MPSNFSGNLNTIGAPVQPMERPRSDYSRQIAGVGESIATLAEAMTKNNDAEWQGAFSTQLADIEAGTARYAETLSDLTIQAKNADAKRLTDIHLQMQRIRNGEVQGLYSPTKARLQIDNLVKTFSSGNPSIAKEIRAMANTAKGNLSAAVNEAMGLDPVVKAAAEIYDAAAKNNMTPSGYLDHQKTMTRIQVAKEEAQLEKLTGEVTHNRVIQGATKFAHDIAKVEVTNLANYLQGLARNGQHLSPEDIDSELANLDQHLSTNVRNYVVEDYGQDGTGSWSFDGNDFNTVMAPVKDSIKNLRDFLKTPDVDMGVKLDLLKKSNELLKERTIAEVWGKNGSLTSALVVARYLGGDGVAGAMLNGVLSYEAKRQALGAAGDTEVDKTLGNMRDHLLATGDVAGAAAISFGFLARGSDVERQATTLFLTGQNFATGNPVIDGAAVANGINIFNETDHPATRRGLAGTILENVQWSRLQRNPGLMAEVARNEALRPMAMAKATQHVLKVLGANDDSADSVVFDATQFNPFNYKEPIGISRPRVEAMIELNKTYREIVTNFGADVALEWVRGLAQPDLQHNVDPKRSFGVPKKKVVTEFDEPISRAEQEYGLPRGLLARVLETESNMDPTAQGPVLDNEGTRALGIAQIVPKWHPGVDPMDPAQAIPYAAKYLRSMYDKYGSWEKALAGYNWGDGADRMDAIHMLPDWQNRLPLQTKNYLRKITSG